MRAIEMFLNREEIKAAGIVSGAVPASSRPTTYDATIGDIIFRGEVWRKDTFVLPKRGIVWVVSTEEFTFADTKTGLATLKTTWTHKGVLALNVGVVDPGWQGPLATAMVNLGSEPVPLKKGDAFFRVMVFQHNQTAPDPKVKPRDIYIREIQDKSTNFAPTFLDTESLVDEVAEQVFKFPRIGVIVGWAGLGIALAGLFLTILAIFAPMAVTVFSDHRSEAVEHQRLEQRVDELQNTIAADRRALELHASKTEMGTALSNATPDRRLSWRIRSPRSNEAGSWLQ
jgi:deoxycytidine triphosphate deaminase